MQSYTYCVEFYISLMLKGWSKKLGLLFRQCRLPKINVPLIVPFDWIGSKSHSICSKVFVTNGSFGELWGWCISSAFQDLKFLASLLLRNLSMNFLYITLILFQQINEEAYKINLKFRKPILSWLDILFVTSWQFFILLYYCNHFLCTRD